MIDERKNVQTPPSTPTASAVDPCPTIIQISRTPQRWKFTQHLCTTRPPPNRQQRVVVNGFKSDLAPVLAGVPQGTVLGPLLSSLYINNNTKGIDSELRLFADDCVCYREIKNIEDTVKLQEDIDRLECWAKSLGVRFQPVKCNIMQITRIKKINASYTLKGTVLDNVEKIEYLCITITNDLKWNTHVSNICTKAKRTLCFPLNLTWRHVQRMLKSRHTRDYGSSVWDPQSILLQDELEKVQKRAARFVTGNCMARQC